MNIVYVKWFLGPQIFFASFTKSKLGVVLTLDVTLFSFRSSLVTSIFTVKPLCSYSFCSSPCFRERFLEGLELEALKKRWKVTGSPQWWRSTSRKPLPDQEQVTPVEKENKLILKIYCRINNGIIHRCTSKPLIFQ